ncbi:MAG: hypothetical protein PUB21_00555, partial [Bacteroidales bacterium]|nr:hypothetical protein [Bacteroidales bacterium]
EDMNLFFKSYLYPTIGFVSAFSFVAIFFSHKSFDIELALKTFLLTFCSLFGGLYVAAYLIREVTSKFFGGDKELNLYLRFSGYSYALLYAVKMVVNLLPDLVFLYVFVLYTAAIVWEGCRNYLLIGEKEQVKFTVVATAILLFSPFVVGTVLKVLLPGLQI